MKITTDNCLSFIQTLIFLAGFLITIWQVNLLRKQISLTTKQLNHQLDWQKKQVTFEYIHKYNVDLKDSTLYLQEKISILRQNRGTIKFSDMLTLVKDDKTRSELYNTVAFFENLAIGIKTKFFDENIAKDSLLNVVISTFYLLEPYLLFRRHETKRMIGNNFESLVKSWEK